MCLCLRQGGGRENVKAGYATLPKLGPGMAGGHKARGTPGLGTARYEPPPGRGLPAGGLRAVTFRSLRGDSLLLSRPQSDEPAPEEEAWRPQGHHKRLVAASLDSRGGVSPSVPTARPVVP